MAVSTVRTGAVRTPAVSQQAGQSFAAFTPSRIVRYRDGGTIKVEGLLNRSYGATVRMDGRIGSPTRGQFFVGLKHWQRPAEKERPMRLDEMKGLSSALKRYLADTPRPDPTTADLHHQLLAAIKGPGAPGKIDIAKIPTGISANGASASVKANLWKDLMPGAGHGGRPVIGVVKVEGTGFNDAPPKFKVESISVYERGSNKPVATFRSPKVVETGGHWGTRSQSYRIEIPKLDLSKKYTVVVNTGINGSKPARVRSVYVDVAKVY